MQPMRRAVIDVGTNSVKLLVADVEGFRVQPVLEQSEQTRLGQGFYETQQLQPAAIAQTARAVAEFAALAGQSQAHGVRVIGTSAARDAINQGDLIRAIETASGLPLEVISGDQEADWVFRGVNTHPALHGQKLLILDVGGGSTEVIVGAEGHHLFRRSFPLGTLRLLEKLRPGDPPSMADLAGCREWLNHFFRDHVSPELKEWLPDGHAGTTRLVGTGGTVTILARMEGKMLDYDRERIEGMRFTRRQILDWLGQLWSLSLAERRRIIGLPPKRADVILTGAAIYGAVMEHVQFDELCVSTRGLRFGAVMS